MAKRKPTRSSNRAKRRVAQKKNQLPISKPMPTTTTVTTQPGTDSKTGSLGTFADVMGAVTLGLALTNKSENAGAVGAEMMHHLMTAMAPRDPLERMLLEHLVWTHQRIQHLTLHATRVCNSELIIAFNDQANKTMNAYRRTMLALKEYRSVPSQTPLVAVQQVNESGSGIVVVSSESRQPMKKNCQTN